MSEQRRTIIRSNKTISNKQMDSRENRRIASIEKMVERRRRIEERNYMDEMKPGTQQISIEHLFHKKKSDSVFIIAGGPSLCGFNFNSLLGYDTIAINAAANFVPNPTYFVTMDYTFLRKKITDVYTLSQGETSTVFVVNMTGSVELKDGVYFDSNNKIRYSRLNEFNHVIESRSVIDGSSGFSRDINGFAHGDNSGFCAIQLAVTLGYEKIYLLGFDMNTDKGLHFHNSYTTAGTSIKIKIEQYRETLKRAISLFKDRSQIISCGPASSLNDVLNYVDVNTILTESKLSESQTAQRNNDLDDLIVVGYYTVNTPYEEEAMGLINSCNRLGLNHDIVGVPNLGNWQSNTRYKASFMLDMLNKHVGKRLLYVDCDAVIHKIPELFIRYSSDISVRYQDFSWRKNECLSGTIYMENNDKTRELCRRWGKINTEQGSNTNSFEQWNLGSVIDDMVKSNGLVFKNLPAEYTFIFDSMRRMYPNAVPVIEHYQASRRFKNKI